MFVLIKTAWAATKKITPSRKRMVHWGSVCAMLPAVGGSLSRSGVRGLLYAFELAGVVLMFAGFLRATTPSPGKR